MPVVKGEGVLVAKGEGVVLAAWAYAALSLASCLACWAARRACLYWAFRVSCRCRSFTTRVRSLLSWRSS